MLERKSKQYLEQVSEQSGQRHFSEAFQIAAKTTWRGDAATVAG